MSNFSYPPPPPPPPSSLPTASSQDTNSAQRIPTFQRGGQGRGRQDGRGSYQGGRGGRQNNAHRPNQASAGGHHNPTFNNNNSHPQHPAQISNPFVGAYGTNPQYQSSAGVSWKNQQHQAGPVAAPPYAQSYAPIASSHPSYYPQASITPQQYSLPTASYPQAPNPYQNNPAAFQYPPPPPPPAVQAPPIRIGFDDKREFRGHSHSRSLDYDSRRFDNSHGYKRKREQSPGRQNNHSGVGGRPGSSGQSYGSSHQHQHNSRPNNHSTNRQKPKPAPSVPNFGFHGLPPKPPSVVSTIPSRDGKDRPKKQKKRKTNQLGLTPKGDAPEVSEPDEDLDEEAEFLKNNSGSASVEFRGRSIAISTPSEIQSWIAERRKKFPTQARVAERQAIQEKRKQAAEERRKQAADEKRAALKAKRDSEQQQKSRGGGKKGATAQPPSASKPNATSNRIHKRSESDSKISTSTSPARSRENEQDRQRRKLERHLRKAEKLRSLLAADGTVSSANTSPVDGAAPAIDFAGASAGANKLVSSVSGASAADSDSDSDLDSSSESDSDAAPESEPTKGRSGPPVKITSANAQKQHSAPTAAQKPSGGAKTNTNVPCKYFVRDGHCRRKHCRFLHTIPEKEGRMGIFERLKERESLEEGMRVVDVIKALGRDGVLVA